MYNTGSGRPRPKRKFDSFASERREESKARHPAYYAKTTRPFARKEAHFADAEFRIYKVAPLAPAEDDNGEIEIAYHVPGEASMLGDMIDQQILLTPTEDGLGFGIPSFRVTVRRIGFVAPRGRTGTMWVTGFPRLIASYLVSASRPVRARDAVQARTRATVATTQQDEEEDPMELEEGIAFDNYGNAL